jgi:hypothetical protein
MADAGRAALRGGVTTIRDLGDHCYLSLGLAPTTSAPGPSRSPCPAVALAARWPVTPCSAWPPWSSQGAQIVSIIHSNPFVLV